MDEFGDLYIPFSGKGIIYRDEFYFISGQLYTVNYADLYLRSPCIESFVRVDSEKSENKKPVIKLLEMRSKVAQTIFESFWRFKLKNETYSDQSKFWPLSYSKNIDLWNNQCEKIVLRTEKNLQQRKRISDEAETVLRFFSTAGSEDLINIDNQLTPLRNNHSLNIVFNIAGIDSLKKICDEELMCLRFLEDRNCILSTLKSVNDVQARSKYLYGPLANFARAAMDSLCVVKALHLFINDPRFEDLAPRISLQLYQGEPTFRGTITDKEIAYVTTRPWQPGMLGNLNIHHRTQGKEFEWIAVKEAIEHEIETHMKPQEIHIEDAIKQIEESAIDAINEEKKSIRTGMGVYDRKELEEIIQSINHVHREEDEPIGARLLSIRAEARRRFEKVFFRLDEKIDDFQKIAANPSLIIDRRYSTMSQEPLTNGNIDFAILTALSDERKAICEVMGLTDENRCDKGVHIYWLGDLPLKNGKSYRYIVAEMTDMANAYSSMLAKAVIYDWSPSAIVLVGIAAAVADEVNVGDVVVGSHIYYYERGKLTPEGQVIEPYMFPADALLYNKAKPLGDWAGVISYPRPGRKKGKSAVHFGVIASGDKVVADQIKRNEITVGHRKIIALEMEGYGVSLAAWDEIEKIHTIVIKGISDKANVKKNDKWRQYASYAAAEFLRYYLEHKPLNLE